MNGTTQRRYESVKLVVALEKMKPQGERELEIKAVLEKAEEVDKWMRTFAG